MTIAQHTITIDRPVEEVWDFLMDCRNDPLWSPNVVAVGAGAGQPVEVGLVVEETYRLLGRDFPVAMTIDELDAPRWSAVTLDGPVPGRGSYALEPTGDGATRFTLTLETQAHGFFKLAEPVFARVLRRDATHSAEQLKDVLEHQVAVA